jgi:hypothetical protein
MNKMTLFGIKDSIPDYFNYNKPDGLSDTVSFAKINQQNCAPIIARITATGHCY